MPKMRFADLKKKMFGDFITWLAQRGFGDPFTNDVWAGKMFDILAQQFAQDRQQAMSKQRMLQAMSDVELQSVINSRVEKK